jgi:hypothetical protein
MKGECTRCLLVAMSLEAMRRELHLHTIWFNTERSHMGLAEKDTPRDLVGSFMTTPATRASTEVAASTVPASLR